jgi:Phage terminase large subunit
MQNHTAESIKSLEGYDIAWVEEAQSLSQRSLDLLRPTIRKQKSELWFSWNPTDKKDPVEKLLRGEPKMPGSIVVSSNWSERRCGRNHDESGRASMPLSTSPIGQNRRGRRRVCLSDNAGLSDRGDDPRAAGLRLAAEIAVVILAAIAMPWRAPAGQPD